MFSIFLYAFNAVMSIALLSGFGYWLKKKSVMDGAFSGKLNSVIFRYGLSINLFFSVYSIDSVSDLPLAQMLFCAIFILLLFAAGLIFAPAITKDNRKRSVLAQAFFRSNGAIIGIPMAGLLGGAEAEGMAAMFLTTSVMLYNALAVLCFTIFDPDNAGQKIDIKAILVKIIKNPLIRGLGLGVICLILRAILPKNSDGNPIISLHYSLTPLYNAISNWSKVASPLMLVILGARFNFDAIASLKKYIAIGVLVRNVAAPLLGYSALFICSSVLHIFAAPPVMYIGLVGILAAPCAVSSAVMAAEMGGDETLASQIVVWSTLFSVLSLFVLIVVLKGLGLM